MSLAFYSYSKQVIAADLLVVANENPLLQYQENGENKGPTIEILNALLQEANLTGNVSFMPWSRAFVTAKDNPNTLVLSMIKTPEREPDFHWLIKVSKLARVFISLASKPENYVENIEQAKEKLIAVILNSAGHIELISQGFSEQKNLYLVSDSAQMINLFVNGRVDLLYTDPQNIKNYLNSSGKTEVALSYKKIVEKNQRTSYIALNKNSDKVVVKKLHQAARKFEKTTEYLRLLVQ